MYLEYSVAAPLTYQGINLHKQSIIQIQHNTKKKILGLFCKGNNT